MIPIDIPEARLTLYFPQSLAECDERQYMEMCELIFKYQAEQISFEDLKIHAVYKLLNIKRSKKQQSEEDDLQLFYNISQLAEIVDTFFEDRDGQKVIIQDYIHNPIPKIKLWRTYHGPYDNFQNLTFGEYTDVLRLFLEFSVSGDYDLLLLIAAILYRPGKNFHFIKKRSINYDGDIRQPYNSNLIERRAEKFKYLPFGFIYGVYLFFASFQQYLTTAIVPWGGKDLDLSILFLPDPDAPEETIQGIGMDSAIFSIAESGVFGSKKETMQTNFWEVIIRMYDTRKRDLEQQKQLQQNDNTSSSQSDS